MYDVNFDWAREVKEAARIVVEYIKGDGNPLGIMDKWFKPIVADNGYSSHWTRGKTSI